MCKQTKNKITIGTIKQSKEKRYIIKTKDGWETLARYKAIKALGKPFSGKHPVHHANGDKTKDVNCNLVICEDAAYHLLLHKRMLESKLSVLNEYQENVKCNKATRKNNLFHYEQKVKQNRKRKAQKKKSVVKRNNCINNISFVEIYTTKVKDT